MSSKNCLNCGQELQHKFCSHCGQKADTHRITVKHFIAHDLLHGVFHIDKGILFTLKETFYRPGRAAMDYIQGKRIRYYNIFYLLLIVIGTNLLLTHFIRELYEKPAIDNVLTADGDGKRLLNFLRQNTKAIILTFIPLFAFNGMIIFRRAKLNFAEHHIVSGFVLLGICCFIVLKNLLGLLPPHINQTIIISSIKNIFSIVNLFFPLYVYYLAFGKQYKILGFLWRIALVYFLFFLEALILISILMIAISGGETQFSGSILMN